MSLTNQRETGAGRFTEALLFLDRQAGELTDRTAAYAFGDISDSLARKPWISRGLVERLIDAMSGDGGTAAPAAAHIARPQPFSAASSPGAN
jgi:hypothetical protein